MPSEILGLPTYLAIAIGCFIVVILLGVIRGGRGGSGAERSASNPLQTIAAIAGLLSFAMQVLQWLQLI